MPPSLLLIYVVSASFVPILRPLPFLSQLYWKLALIRRTIAYVVLQMAVKEFFEIHF